MERYSGEFDTDGVRQQLAGDPTLGYRDLRQQLLGRRPGPGNYSRLGGLQSAHDLGHLRDSD